MNKTLRMSPRLIIGMMAGVLLSGTSITAKASAICADLTDCERKICEKENELGKAKEYGDVDKILGLQNSLVHLKDSCAQKPNISIEKYEGKVAELKDEYRDDLDDALDEYEDDLADAKSEGKLEKIERAKDKYEQKVQKITNEYESKLRLLETIQ